MTLLPRSPGRRITLVAVMLGVLVTVPHGATATGTSDPLTYGGGQVMTSSTTYAIFWLPTLGGQATHFEPSGSDLTYETLIGRFLGDVGSTTYYNIVTQYPGNGGSISPTSTLGGSWVDTTAPASGAAGTEQQPLQDADMQAEVQLAMQRNGWTASPTTLFLVYTGTSVESCADLADSQCGWTTYCAYHSSFVPSGTSQPVYYASVPDPGSNGGNCQSQTGSNPVYPDNDALADSAISLTSRELFASVTDAGGDGWSDSSGAEIDDKCAWTFGTINSNGSNVTLNGDPYLLQEEWSNADSACVLSYGTVPTPTPGTPSTRLTPTPPVVGTPTPTPTPIAGEANRLTPTPPVAGTPTPTPTPAGGTSRNPGLFFLRVHVRSIHSAARAAEARRGGVRRLFFAHQRAVVTQITVKGKQA